MRASERVSKRSVDALTCPSGKDRVFLWDRDLSGFGVIAFPSGKKSYVVQYRRDGRSRRFRIGDHGRLTPEEARSIAKMTLGDIEHGGDPLRQRQAARAVRSFSEIAFDFLNGHVRAKRKPNTADAYETTLRLHILPTLGATRISEIGVAEISRLQLALIDQRATANKALAIISSAWRWAEKRNEPGLGPNPVSAVDKFAGRSCERFLSTDELRRLGDSLRQGETTGIESKGASDASLRSGPDVSRRVTLDPFAVAAIRLLALTGARLREVLHLRWEHVDFERGLLFLPDSKTGAKTIYLSEPALRVLAGVPRVAGNMHVFPGSVVGAPRHDLKKPWAAVTRAAGLEGLRLHDLRHSYASVGAGAQMGLPVIGKLLGHSQSSTTQRYAHLGADPLHRAANAIGATIAAALGAPSENASERRPESLAGPLVKPA